MSWKALVVFTLLLALFLVPLFTDVPLGYINSLIGEHYLRSAIAFVFLMFAATVVAPLTVPFAVPAAAPFLGPFPAALLAILGWTLGALVAFLISRQFGRTLVAKIIDIKKLDRLEGFIPERGLFWSMVLFRMLLPVDVLSYTLGLFPRVRLVPYLVATVLGIAPFAFIFAYAGDALLAADYGRVVGLLGMSAILLGVGWLWIIRAKA